jgi:O-antigen ligase
MAAFSFTLAVAVFVSADALFPLLVSGGQEIDIDTAATARVRTLCWLVFYALAGTCFALSWRALFEAMRNNVLFIVLIGWAFASVLWSAEPWRSAYSATQLGVLTLFALTAAERLPLERSLLVATLVYAGMIALSLGFVALRPDLGISSSIMYSGAWRGIFIHKNHFGTQLSFAFVTFFVGVLISSGYLRWLLMTFVILALALSILSRSSTALLTCTAVPVVYFMLRAAAASRSLFYGILGVGVAGLALAAGVLAMGWSTIMDVLGKDSDLSGRTELWSMIFASIESRPLLGFGYDAYWLSNARDGGAVITRSLVWSPGGAHNGWIELTTQLGFIGLLLWALVFLQAMSRGVGIGLSKRAGRECALMWLALLCIPIISWSLVESNIMRHGNSVHFMFALAAGYLSHQPARSMALVSGRRAPRPV